MHEERKKHAGRSEKKPAKINTHKHVPAQHAAAVVPNSAQDGAGAASDSALDGAAAASNVGFMGLACGS